MSSNKSPRERSQDQAATPAVGEGKRGASGHIAYLLRQAHGAVRHAMDRDLAETGLTAPQFVVLNLLDAYKGASGAQLARVAQLTPQTMNLIVRKLEAEKWLVRSEPGANGRVLHIELTASGKAKLKICKRIADKVEAKILSLLGPNNEPAVRQWLAAVAVSLES
jgi:DNA-binding MarR family transcriptional regulator